MDAKGDRLSGLQDDLALKILSFVGLKDAIGTSVLSSRWRYLWTLVPNLSFSSQDFPTMDKFSDFVTHVLSRRNNQFHLSSVKLYICGNNALDVAQRIMNHAFSLNVQQLNVTCLFDNKRSLFENNRSLFEKNPVASLSVSSAQTLKYFRLSRRPLYSHITLTSTQELSSLTTLHLDHVTLYDGFFSKCPNLENLTLNSCKTLGSEVLSICHHRLSNLTVEDIEIGDVNVVTPQLKNLTMSRYFGRFQISAPELASLLFKGPAPFMFSTNRFRSLEKAELSIYISSSLYAPIIISLLQKLHNQSSFTKHGYHSDQPSPLTNLEILKILPKVGSIRKHGHVNLIMLNKVLNYLVNSSPKATVTKMDLDLKCQRCGFVGLEDDSDGFFYCQQCERQVDESRVIVDDDTPGPYTCGCFSQQVCS